MTLKIISLIGMTSAEVALRFLLRKYTKISGDSYDPLWKIMFVSWAFLNMIIFVPRLELLLSIVGSFYPLDPYPLDPYGGIDSRALAVSALVVFAFEEIVHIIEFKWFRATEQKEDEAINIEENLMEEVHND